MNDRSLSRRPLLIAMLLLTLSLAACTPAAPADGRLGVVLSIAPQRYLVERIGGEHVRVNVMVGAGDNPHTYEPKPDQLKALSSAAVYFATGVEFEDVWMGRIAGANRAMRVVDTAAGIERLPLPEHHDEGDEEEEDGDHAGGLDPHVWTSPRLAAQQARVMAAALAELDPPHATDYAANLAALEGDIAALDADLRATLAGVQGRKFMVFHPSWGYFARDYGLEQIAVEVGGQEPSAQELAALITTARAEGIRVVFAQPEFSTANATTIAREIGGEVLLISPLAEDWLDNLRTVADAFGSALAE
jgi:zinc transport system substrate-binding protein